MNINIKDFDRTLGVNWDMPRIDRSLDTNLIDDYLDQLSAKDREFISKLLQNTTYIQYSQMKQDLNMSFKLFQNSIGEEAFYLYLPETKIGSEHWLTAILWPQLRQLNIQGIIHSQSKIPVSSRILIIDDAIYSGNNVLMATDQFSHNLATKYNISQNEVLKQLSWFLVIPYICPSGKQAFLSFLDSMNGNAIIYNVKYIYELNTMINVEDYYPGDTFSELYERFGFEGYDHPCVYFDHKVAAVNSTYPTIYIEGRIPDNGYFGTLLKNITSREQIEELSDLLLNN